MNVLVTGATGFVGANVARLLVGERRDAVDWFVAYGYAPPPPAYRARVA